MLVLAQQHVYVVNPAQLHYSSSGPKITGRGGTDLVSQRLATLMSPTAAIGSAHAMHSSNYTLSYLRCSTCQTFFAICLTSSVQVYTHCAHAHSQIAPMLSDRSSPVGDPISPPASGALNALR